MITGAETAHLGLRPAPIYLEGRLPVLEAKVAAELGLRDGQVVQATVESRSGALQLQLQQLQSQNMARVFELPRELVATLRLVAGDTVSFRVQMSPSGVITLRPQTISSFTSPGGTAASSSGAASGQSAPSATASSSTPAVASASTSVATSASTSTSGTLSAANAAAAAPASETESPSSSLAGDSRLEQLITRPPTLGTLEQVLRPDVLAQFSKNASMPDVQAALTQWMRMRPQMATLTAERLIQYLSVSGWFTESALSQGRLLGAFDLKTVLRMLARSSSQASTAGTLHQALDEVESQQVAATGVDTSRDWGFSMVIPFADADPMTLRFSRGRPQTPDEEAAPMYVHMHTRSRDHGELWLQTCIRDRTQVEMVMWALREDVAERARVQSSNLAEELASAGLRMSQFQVIHGARPTELPQWMSPEAQGSQGRLVDVQT